MPNILSAEIVSSFDVQGNTRLDRQAIINYLPFGVGDNPNIQKIDTAVKALLGSDPVSYTHLTLPTTSRV